MDSSRLEKAFEQGEIRSYHSHGFAFPSRLRSLALKAGLAALIIVFTGFIALPVASLFMKVSPEALFRALGEPVVIDALALSLVTSGVTTLIIVAAGTPVSYVNARFDYFGKGVVDALIELPLILPPAVAGIALLMAFGRMGVLGQQIASLGLSVPFTTVAVVIAQAFVSAPFYMRQARTSFEDVDTAYEGAARTLGAGRICAFVRITLPMAGSGLVSGAVMTFARALGEFGATIMFAGNFQGRTQTMPLAIYTAMQGDLDAALCLAVILVIFSFTVIAVVKVLGRRASRSGG